MEQIARMVAKGFEETGDHIKGLGKEIQEVKQELKEDIRSLKSQLDLTDARVGRMEADISEIRGNIVYKYEFEDLSARVKYLELKLGVESGK